MAVGYTFKPFVPSATVASGNDDIFTVPASHDYVIKSLVVHMTADNSTATTVKFQVSDAAGANFRDITPLYSTGATNGDTKIITLCSSMSLTEAPPTATPNSITDSAVFLNFGLVAGQVLRAVVTQDANGFSVICATVADYSAV